MSDVDEIDGPALSTCPHLSSLDIRQLETLDSTVCRALLDPSHWHCIECMSTESVRACMVCGSIRCDEHALTHSYNPAGATRRSQRTGASTNPPTEEQELSTPRRTSRRLSARANKNTASTASQHSIAIDINEGGVFCYPCKKFIDVRSPEIPAPVPQRPVTRSARLRMKQQSKETENQVERIKKALVRLLDALDNELTQSKPTMSLEPEPLVDESQSESFPTTSEQLDETTHSKMHGDQSATRALNSSTRALPEQTSGSPILRRKRLGLRESSIFARDISEFEARDELLSLLKQWKLHRLQVAFDAWRKVTQRAKEERLAAQSSNQSSSVENGQHVTSVATKLDEMGSPMKRRKLCDSSDSNSTARSEVAANSPSSDLDTTLAMASPAVLVPPPSPSSMPLSSLSDALNQSLSVPTRRFSHVGLRNLGNTCYLNAVIQAIYNSPRVRQYFLSYEFLAQFAETWHRTIKSNGDNGAGNDDTNNSPLKVSTLLTKKDTVALMEEVTDKKQPRQVLLSRELHYLFRVLAAGKWACVTPQALLGNLWMAVPSFRNHRQQDAEELLTFLLDRLDYELRRNVRPAQSNGNESAVPAPSSVIGDLFQGSFASVITCSRCNKPSVTHQPFFDVLLDIPPQHITFASRSRARALAKASNVSTCHLTELFDHFIAPVTIHEFKCDKCNQTSEAQLQLSFSRLPNVLVLVIKRFAWNNSGQKVDTPISFPVTDFDLSKYTLANNYHRKQSAAHSSDETSTTSSQGSSHNSNSYSYNLTAVIVHQGTRLSSGHYFTYCLDRQHWVQYNDSKVTPVDVSEVERCEAYLLFYERCQSTQPVSDPTTPSISNSEDSSTTPLPSPVVIHQPALSTLQEEENESETNCDKKSASTCENQLEATTTEAVIDNSSHSTGRRTSQRLKRKNSAKNSTRQQKQQSEPMEVEEHSTTTQNTPLRRSARQAARKNGR